MMRKTLYILFFFCAYTYTADQAKQKITPRHSNIFVQKITNESDKTAFICFERLRSTIDDMVNMSGPVITGNHFGLQDPEGHPYSISVPVWQKTFQGNHLNIITLSGNPGRIFFLYTINGHLWAIAAPEKSNELKGIHLLDPSKKERYIEIKLLNNNVIKVIDITADESERVLANRKAELNKTAPSLPVTRQKLMTPIITQQPKPLRGSLRHETPFDKRTRLGLPRPY